MTDNTNGDYAAWVEHNRKAAQAETHTLANSTDTTTFLQSVGRFIEARVKLATAPLLKRIEELEATGIKYVGTYQRAAEYKRGDVCNYDGGMWVATCETPPQEVPGKSVCWQLSVKSYNGKDHTPRQPTGERRP